jgi:DNA-binding transcriptional ArsR family regulator
MAFSKKHLYSLTAQRTSEYCKALSYPARLDILETLQHKGKLTVHEIHVNHPISRESLSDHLRILRTAKLIEPEEHYPYTFYKVNEANLREAFQLIALFMARFRF